MDDVLYRNLFTGPNDAQMARCRAIEKLQLDYLDWVRANPAASLAECEKKYAELKTESGL